MRDRAADLDATELTGILTGVAGDVLRALDHGMDTSAVRHAGEALDLVVRHIALFEQGLGELDALVRHRQIRAALVGWAEHTLVELLERRAQTGNLLFRGCLVQIAQFGGRRRTGDSAVDHGGAGLLDASRVAGGVNTAD